MTTDADRRAAEKLFNNALTEIGQFAEYGDPFDRICAIDKIASAFTAHRHRHRALDEAAEVARKAEEGWAAYPSDNGKWNEADAVRMLEAGRIGYTILKLKGQKL